MKRAILAIAAMVLALAPLSASASNDHTTICHPVGSATGGNTHAGYSIITPANPSSHIDEETGEPKHEHDGRVDFVVDEAHPCPPEDVDECPTAAGRTNDDCEPEPELDPRGRFFGPCADPMYAAGFDNRRSDGPVTFRFTWYQSAKRGWMNIVRVVDEGETFVTRLVHVIGGTRMTIRGDGEVLVTQRGARGGFGPCPDAYSYGS